MLVDGGPTSMYILATLTGLSGIIKQSAYGWEEDILKDLKKREGAGFEQNPYLYASALVTVIVRVGWW